MSRGSADVVAGHVYSRGHEMRASVLYCNMHELQAFCTTFALIEDTMFALSWQSESVP